MFTRPTDVSHRPRPLMSEDGTDYLVRETWHAATSLNVFDPSAEFTLSAVEVLSTSLVRHW